MKENVLKFSQLQLPLGLGQVRNGRNPQDLDGVVSLQGYRPQAVAPSETYDLSHNVYCAKAGCTALDTDSIEGKKPNGGGDLDSYITNRLEELNYLTTNFNPNLKNRSRRIRQVVAELRTHWQLLNEVRGND